ncbi:hypothetical protein GE21DRAFT_2579 [Neurospora crassa]|uniref:Uncharacterized protein n=1 Tax=Neurospora crassa (strain ATCC 24698 / 74-OR23-1A / CBS 708.71 / DSM 1257 / FGSC 987) TaxID=367110 RepID=V5IRJ0_NEUCR|nr:hypothetical protein NCU08599 [Neurospora crassa OR74A]ESA44404.1 hypothetical protein NCU08599 [Neurospora crassa OR74A]KHE78778.1 hypothetical protein GE21DRAFT_2579 [Neurospora crassa]|eukprot:XP_011393210.1 hypothetical protein NCU08599 [Neurospora crassa OR74A]
MSASPDNDSVARCESPEALPSPAVGAPVHKFMRCASATSAISHGSESTERSRDSLISDAGSAFSRSSSGTFPVSSRRSEISTLGHFFLRSRDNSWIRNSTGSLDSLTANSTISSGSSSKRRGYMRPQGTDFAQSARQRESVLSLGSIAHLQYYFARTGLLDGKGAQFARKRQQKAQTLDLSMLEGGDYTIPRVLNFENDSSYASMGSSPNTPGLEPDIKSPTGDEHNMEFQPPEEEFGSDYDEETDQQHMLPPTVSTYNQREKPIPKPPSMEELRAELTSALNAAERSLKEANEATAPAGESAPPSDRVVVPPAILLSDKSSKPNSSEQESSSPVTPTVPLNPTGWYEIQGMHILDVMTLAIRAAKIYYTSHERPDRLDAIKSEKDLRADLLSVMDILKKMATRGFIGGMRDDEFQTMNQWIKSLRDMLSKEDEMEVAEQKERESWTWLKPENWPTDENGNQIEREEAFIHSMLAGLPLPPPLSSLSPLPKWTPIDRSSSNPEPTPFLRELSNGIRLVHLHNCAVRKSRRRFGAIPSFHADTQKPYRAADNLRYWMKAAELRWEVMIKCDALGLQYAKDGKLENPEEGGRMWVDFEEAVVRWCRGVRAEVEGELRGNVKP